MKFLKDSFLWILLVASICFWYYVDQDRKSICIKPLPYTITSYDPRFKISKEDFLKAAQEAETIWENAYGKDLLEYVEKYEPNIFYESVGKYFLRGVIGVGLVYDDRQKNSETHQALVSEVDGRRADADSIKFQFESEQVRYKEASREYQKMVEQYHAHVISFDLLEARRREVNAMADEINSLIKKYNALVGELNSTVGVINETAGKEFEEGQYVRDQDGERINIYEFGTRAGLVRVLAHEFGHALGLDHNDNPDSIMYYLNDSNNMKPTEEDLGALYKICKAR